MPVYSHACQDCGPFEESYPLKDFEKNVTMPCPECGQEAPREIGGYKVAANLRQGGVGWALNGYHNDGYKHYDLTPTTEERNAAARKVKDRKLWAKSVREESRRKGK